MSILLAVIYISFIGLGLPDALLGAAWPNIYPNFEVPISYAGIVSMIIALGTVISSLQSDRLTKKYGTAKITITSVGLTALAIWGFSISNSFIMLCLWAIPYGLGAGSVDAALNNYVAIHYESKHMSWLHCMWGIGAALGPYIMGAILTGGASWKEGYGFVAKLQIALTAILFVSYPIWKESNQSSNEDCNNLKTLHLTDVLKDSRIRAILICFFCYSAIEQTTMLWASSYLNLAKEVSEQVATTFASMFCIGITIGRGINGFIAMRLNDKQMIRMGQIIILLGVIVMFLPTKGEISLISLVLVGLGCAPIYPCIIHSTPDHFGEENSQAVIGFQMASAYIGTSIMPPLFGLIAQYISIRLLPLYLLILLVLMVCCHELLERSKI